MGSLGQGGGVADYGIASTFSMANSTVSGNGGHSGGGIFNQGSLTLTNSTLSQNTAANGGGIAAAAEGAVTVANSIVAGNSGTNSGPDIYGIFTDNGHNLLGTALQGSTFGPGDVFSNIPDLTPLQNNGGPTFNMAPLPGSPALGAGDNTGGPDTDQARRPPPQLRRRYRRRPEHLLRRQHHRRQRRRQRRWLYR